MGGARTAFKLMVKRLFWGFRPRKELDWRDWLFGQMFTWEEPRRRPKSAITYDKHLLRKIGI